ncbi:hypothetical protein C8R34_12326 [Nitrosomonas sp. Nm84]|uniref:hypothetical protein n=1 Tax=Nitrosomonas sp. Nm84 TaxID=200124 RepID=UPI000D75F604|nr:hypothetical protein [Nitrosomonas sp. Nm84]PXW84937.1 hypothetical protein C8R34_12326 [Nitrosomonas sp. Nm84]
MKFSILKQVAMVVFGGLMMSQAGSVLADNQGGSFTTGLAAGVDFYQITCFDDGNGAPSYAEAQVKDMTANTSKVNILLYKGTACTTNKCAQSSLDTTDSDTGYSPLIKVTQGAGTYYLFVKHTASGTDSYDVSAHCKTSGNVHTGTSFISRQQQ